MRPDGDIRIRAGSLRHYVTFQKLGPTSPPTYNAAGEVLEWAPVFVNVSASIGPARASSVYKDQQGIALVVIPITCRYLSGITSDMQITWQNGTYSIEGILDIDERNWLMEIECTLRGAGL